MTDLKTTAGKIEDLSAKLTESRAPQGEVPAARSAIEAKRSKKNAADALFNLGS